MAGATQDVWRLVGECARRHLVRTEGQRADGHGGTPSLPPRAPPTKAFVPRTRTGSPRQYAPCPCPHGPRCSRPRRCRGCGDAARPRGRDSYALGLIVTVNASSKEAQHLPLPPREGLRLVRTLNAGHPVPSSSTSGRGKSSKKSRANPAGTNRRFSSWSGTTASSAFASARTPMTGDFSGILSWGLLATSLTLPPRPARVGGSSCW